MGHISGCCSMPVTSMFGNKKRIIDQGGYEVGPSDNDGSEIGTSTKGGSIFSGVFSSITVFGIESLYTNLLID